MYVSHTYLCANMCKSTNWSWSCHHPKQMLPQFLSSLVNLETSTLLPTHGHNFFILLNVHDGVKYSY